jgi:predicted permease
MLLHSSVQFNGWTTSDNNETVYSYPMYQDLAKRNDVFTGIGARARASVNMRHGNESERADAELVSGNFFEVLGARPAIGRTLTADDDRTPGAHPVIVLSHGFWTSRFGASVSILNQNVQINGMPMTVVGVLPANFRSLLSSSNPSIYIPIAMKKQVTPTWDGLTDRGIMWLSLFGRLKPGIERTQAEAKINGLFHSLIEEHIARTKVPERARNRLLTAKMTLRPGEQGIHDLREDWQTPIFALMAMTGFVLLIACANVANLLLAKSMQQRKEIALRFAIGASRYQVIRQVMVESLALAILGGALGLLLAGWTTDALVKLAGDETPLSSHVNPRVLLFTIGVSVFTGILFGIVPAFRASRTDVNTALKEQGAGLRSSTAHAGFRKTLVAAQMALSMALLVSAGTFATNLYRIIAIDPGFKTANLIQFRLAPKLSGYDHPRSVQFLRNLQARLSQLPSVESVGAAEIQVLSNSGRSGNVTVEGYRAKEDENTNANQNPISPGYFRTLGIPLIAGREFNDRDDIESPKTVIVNQRFAKRYFGDESPLGRHMTFGGGDVKLDREIVGLVQDSKHSSLTSKIPEMVYFPYTQDPGLASIAFYVRSSRDVTAMSNVIRAAVRELDANVPIFELMSTKAQLDRSVSSARTLAFLSNAFGFLATLLAAIGLYGVISHSVTSRTGEIGIRIALGANRLDVVRMVLREVTFLSVLGIASGLVLALWLGKYIETQLFQMKATDPLVLLGATAVLATIAFLAGWFPARRAARTDPMTALRHQ